MREVGNEKDTCWPKGSPDVPGTHAAPTDGQVVMASFGNVGPGPCASSPRYAGLRALAVTWKVNWKVWRSGTQTRQGACRALRSILPSGNVVLRGVMEQWHQSHLRVLGRAGMYVHAHTAHSPTITACQTNQRGFAEDLIRAHQNADRYRACPQGAQELTGRQPINILNIQKNLQSRIEYS